MWLALELSDSKLSDNKLSDNKLSGNNLVTEFVENRSFLTNHKCNFYDYEEYLAYCPRSLSNDI